jgi:hypothetical protein
MRKSKIREIIRDEIKPWGLLSRNPYYAWREWFYEYKSEPLEKLENKLNHLLKHLNLEYYKKEIKETNGDVKTSVEEGFRELKVG